MMNIDLHEDAYRPEEKMEKGRSFWRVGTIAYGLLVALLFTLSDDSLARDLQKIYQSGYIVLAHRDQSPPLSYTLPNGQPVGMAVEICQRFVEELSKVKGGVQLAIKYKAVTAKNRIEYIKSGQADLECGSTTNNAERREQVSFTVPHYITGARLLVSADSNIAAISDPTLQRVASTSNTTPLKRVRELKSINGYGFEVIEVRDHQEGVGMVMRGEINGFVMDEVLLVGLSKIKENGDQLKIVGKYLTIEPLAIMVDKDAADLSLAINRIAKIMVLDGEFLAIYSKWFELGIPPNQESIGLPLNYLTKDLWKYPTEKMP